MLAVSALEIIGVIFGLAIVGALAGLPNLF
jgi:hypothetical protein